MDYPTKQKPYAIIMKYLFYGKIANATNFVLTL